MKRGALFEAALAGCRETPAGPIVGISVRQRLPGNVPPLGGRQDGQQEFCDSLLDDALVLLLRRAPARGRRYADPASFLMPADRWDADRHELAVTFGRSVDGAERLAELEADQRVQLQRLQTAIDAGEGVRLYAGGVVIDAVTAPAGDVAAQRLTIELARRLPRLEITDGYDIAEVEGWDVYVRLRELSAATWLFSRVRLVSQRRKRAPASRLPRGPGPADVERQIAAPLY